MHFGLSHLIFTTLCLIVGIAGWNELYQTEAKPSKITFGFRCQTLITEAAVTAFDESIHPETM